MPQTVYVANTNVEFECATSSLLSLEKSWSQHPLCLQLQFLPLLFAQSDDIVAVTALPNSNYLKSLEQTGWWQAKQLPQLIPMKEIEPFYGKRCCSWGPSRQVQAWAEARHMNYSLPQSWQVICLVNSKAFSFRYTTLSEAALLYNEEELLIWLKDTSGPKILKSCFGLSGQGNRYINDASVSSEILVFCRKEWQQKRPLIGEPCLNRLYDFSTQWCIHQNQQIEWIGATRFETDLQGQYLGTLAGPEEILFASFKSFLQEHKKYAQKALEDIAKMGFFGFIGIDALLYRDAHTQDICLYPIVEINGRQTMSLVALRLQKNICPHKILRLTFQPKTIPQTTLLPTQLVNFKGKIVDFSRSLSATILPIDLLQN